MASVRPLIGIPADRRMVGPHPFHMVGEKYTLAVLEASDALPLLIPSLGEELRLNELLERLDGILFTGSLSNVEPHHYDGTPSEPGTLHDPARDATTLPLIRKAVEAGVPVLGLCRGFQEMNVAFGGTLHQKVHEVPGYNDHRDDTTQPLDVQYGPAHDVILEPGGMLPRHGRRRSRQGQFAPLPGRRAARPEPSCRGAGARWPDRGLSRAERAALRGRCAMASRVAGHGESVLPSTLRRLWGSGP